MNRIPSLIAKPLSIAITSVLLGFGAAQVQAQQTVPFDIPPQSLSDALLQFGDQSGRDIMTGSGVTDSIRSQGFSGDADPETALKQLLDRTGLTYRRDGNIFVIMPAADASNDGAGTQVRLEEIYVTARKRQETIQEIPISITAFSAADLRAAGIRGLGDMEGIVPGVNMGGGGNGVKKDSNPFIRGVGQRETKVTLDPAVGTYIDGIYLARTAGAMLDTIGIERVEVLRGPQGTLFGKNTTGGAISVTTIKPENEFSGSVSVNVGNYGRSDGAFSLNVPLIDNTLLARLTVASKNSDGYFTNIVDNTQWGGDDRVTGIGQLRWLPTDNLMFDLLAERTRIRETPRPQRCAFAREDGFTTIPVSSINGFRQNSGLPTFEELCKQSEALPDDKFSSDFSVNGEAVGKQGRYWVDTATIGLTGTWDIGQIGALNDVQLKSVSSWREVEQIADEDLDGVGAPYLLRVQPDFTASAQISQEFQLNGSALNERLFFSTGLYYFEEETPKDDIIRAAGVASRPNGPAGQFRIMANEPTLERLETDNESYAWYGQLDFELSSQLELTMGLRYTQEKRWSQYSKAYANKFSLGPGNPAGSNSPHYFEYGGCAFQCGYQNDSPVMNTLYDWEFITAATESLSTKDSAWTPMVSLKYRFQDEILDRLSINEAMIYATYSEGFHAGGVTAGAIDLEAGQGLGFESINGEMVLTRSIPGTGAEDPVIFKPEKVKSYELGMKLQAFDRRIQANMAAFYMDYTDMQVTSTGSRAGIPIPMVENVGNSVIHGFEGEFVFLPTMNWRIMANVAYTDADMKEWEAQKIILSAFDGSVTGVTTERRDDEPMPRVPRWQAFLMTDYTFNLPNGGWITPSVSARYTSEIYHGFDRGSYLYGKEAVTAEAATFIDARIGYLSADEKIEIALWAKNLGNKTDYLVGGIPLVDVTGATGQIYANPRTFGLEFTYNFGG